jgi:hypothetical protein
MLRVFRAKGSNTLTPETDAWNVGSGFGPICRFEPAFHRTGEQEFHQAFIASARSSFQKIFTSINALHVEHLAGFDVVPLPNRRWQDNLAFTGDGSLHAKQDYRLTRSL